MGKKSLRLRVKSLRQGPVLERNCTFMTDTLPYARLQRASSRLVNPFVCHAQRPLPAIVDVQARPTPGIVNVLPEILRREACEQEVLGVRHLAKRGWGVRRPCALTKPREADLV